MCCYKYVAVRTVLYSQEKSPKGFQHEKITLINGSHSAIWCRGLNKGQVNIYGDFATQLITYKNTETMHEWLKV